MVIFDRGDAAWEWTCNNGRRRFRNFNLEWLSHNGGGFGKRFRGEGESERGGEREEGGKRGGEREGGGKRGWGR